MTTETEIPQDSEPKQKTIDEIYGPLVLRVVLVVGGGGVAAKLLQTDLWWLGIIVGLVALFLLRLLPKTPSSDD